MEDFSTVLMQWLNLIREGQTLLRRTGEERTSAGDLVPPSFSLGQIPSERKESADWYADFFSAIFQEAYNAKRHRENKWKEIYKAYNNEYDFGYKAASQAKAYVPRLTRNVDVVTAYLKRAMAESQHASQVYVTSPTWGKLVMASAIQRLVRYLLDDNEFEDTFLLLTKTGLLSGLMAAKVHVQLTKKMVPILDSEGRLERAEERAMHRIVVEPVSPFNLWLDPTGRNKYIIHRILVDRSDLDDWVEMELLDGDAVKRLIELGQAQGSQEAPFGKPAVYHPEYRPTFVIAEYWGDVWDKDGKIIHRNVWGIWGAPLSADLQSGSAISSEIKWVFLRGWMPNPYWHGRSPFVVAQITPRPTDEIYPKSLVEDLVEVQVEYTRLFNALLDGAHFDAIPLFEVYLTALADAQQLSHTDLIPGKMLRKRLAEPAIHPVNLGKMPTNAAFMINLLERILTEGFGLTETVLGYLSTRGRPTATEVVTARAQATSALDEIARLIETNFLEPLFTLIYQLALQVLPDIADPSMEEALGETIQQLLALSPHQREALARGAYQFRVKGISLVLTKMQELAKILQFLEIMGTNPLFAQRLNWDRVLAKVIEAFGWDPAEILIQSPLTGHIPPEIAQPQGGQQAQATPEIPLTMPAREDILQGGGAEDLVGSLLANAMRGEME